MRTTPQTTPSTTARVTGWAYLGIIATGIFAEFVVRGSLVVPDDAIATATNIADAVGLFRVGIGADLAMIAFDVTVAVGLYRLVRGVDLRLARAITALRLVQAAVIVMSLSAVVSALDLARGAVTTDGVVTEDAAHDVLAAIEHHALGYDAGLIAFGLCCIVLGHVLRTWALTPSLLAKGMTVTGVVYLVGSLAAFAAPGLGAVIDPFYVIPLVVELWFALWLIRHGLGPTSRRAVVSEDVEADVSAPSPW